MQSSKTIAEADLRQVANTCGKGFELIFYAALRDEVRRGLKTSPEILWFKGLRGCVKDLTGAQRWCRRCEAMSDQIVDFLRGCLSQESKGGDSCALIVL